MRKLDERFYAAVPASPVRERAFGLDLRQHGFADLAQLVALIEAASRGPG